LITVDGKLEVIAGASRSGKTAYTVRAVKRLSRICAYDPEDQWSKLPGWRGVGSRAALWDALQKGGALRLAFVPGGDIRAEFDYWARAVFYAGRYVQPLGVIAEELADVTNAGKAPGHWGLLLRRGLKRGIDIFAISQRWSEADKTGLGNASSVVMFRQSSGDDVRYLARKFDVTEADIAGLLPTLKPDGNIKVAPYLKKDMRTGQIARLELRF
jgi:hypothetical protein